MGYMKTRYIELFESDEQEWNRVTTRVQRKINVPISYNSFVILMRGLPYSAQEDDCLLFFQNVKCLGVHIPHDKSDRPAGVGFAEFESEEEMNKALAYDNKYMRSR